MYDPTIKPPSTISILKKGPGRKQYQSFKTETFSKTNIFTWKCELVIDPKFGPENVEYIKGLLEKLAFEPRHVETFNEIRKRISKNQQHLSLVDMNDSSYSVVTNIPFNKGEYITSLGGCVQKISDTNAVDVFLPLDDQWCIALSAYKNYGSFFHNLPKGPRTESTKKNCRKKHSCC